MAASSAGLAPSHSPTSRATSAAPPPDPVTPPQNRHPITLWGRIRAQAEKYLFQFEVTVGLYMLDWWERQVFYVVALSLIWFLSYQTLRYCERTFHGFHGGEETFCLGPAPMSESTHPQSRSSMQH